MPDGLSVSHAAQCKQAAATLDSLAAAQAKNGQALTQLLHYLSKFDSGNVELFFKYTSLSEQHYVSKASCKAQEQLAMGLLSLRGSWTSSCFIGPALTLIVCLAVATQAGPSSKSSTGAIIGKGHDNHQAKIQAHYLLLHPSIDFKGFPA